MNLVEKIKNGINDIHGQAFSTEAFLSAIIITLIIIFVVPSFATPISTDSLEDNKQQAQVEKELDSMLDTHRNNGQLRGLLLNYYIDGWQENKQRSEDPNAYEDRYQVGPSGGAYALPGVGSTEGYYFIAPGPVGASISEIEKNHDVWIHMYIVPESEAGSTNPDRIKILGEDTSDTVVARESTTLALYEDDRLRSIPETHDRFGGAVPQTDGAGGTLQSLPSTEYPLERHNNPTGSNVYTTVNVETIAYLNTTNTPT